MRTLLVLVVGIAIGAFGYYLYVQHPAAGVNTGSSASRDLSTSARDAADTAVAKTRAVAADVSQALSDKIREWHLTREDIHADLQKGGAVARENASRAREKVADARIVAMIKAKLVLDRDLEASAISVESRDGDVTLSGNVASESLIGKAVALAMDTDGVHHVTAKLKPSE
jgi:osmotically-inducible protein OsmY